MTATATEARLDYRRQAHWLESGPGILAGRIAGFSTVEVAGLAHIATNAARAEFFVPDPPADVCGTCNGATFCDIRFHRRLMR